MSSLAFLNLHTRSVRIWHEYTFFWWNFLWGMNLFAEYFMGYSFFFQSFFIQISILPKSMKFPVLGFVVLKNLSIKSVLFVCQSNSKSVKAVTAKLSECVCLIDEQITTKITMWWLSRISLFPPFLDPRLRKGPMDSLSSVSLSRLSVRLSQKLEKLAHEVMEEQWRRSIIRKQKSHTFFEFWHKYKLLMCTFLMKMKDLMVL